MPVRNSRNGQSAWARLVRQAQCADTDLDADLWFPVNPHPVRARREAAEAIAICDACPVRAHPKRNCRCSALAKETTQC